MNDRDIDDRARSIAVKLQAARRARRRPFGSSGHEMRITAPLSEQQVGEFEQYHQVSLPAEYRTFLTCVANGGAGPGYGMFSLEEAIPQEWQPLPAHFLRTPFPHVNHYNDAEDPVVEAYRGQIERGEFPEEEAERWEVLQTSGTVLLCHEGCGYVHFLVVTGPTRGTVWIDNRASDCGLFPLGVGFMDWYERWLDDTLAGGDGNWWMRNPDQD